MALTRIRAEQISNLDYKQAVKVVTTTDIIINGAPDQVDGISLSVGDRILVTGQIAAEENGIYQVATLGTGSDGVWIRSPDANSTGDLNAGAIVTVTEGDAHKDTVWELITNDPIIIGVTPLEFRVFRTEATAAGDPGQVQYNADGVLAGSANLSFVDGEMLTVGGNVLPALDVTYDLGSSTQRWKDLYLSGNTIYLGNLEISETAEGDLQLPGNVYVGNVLLDGANGNLDIDNLVANTVTTTGNIDTSGNINANSGTITANLIVANNVYINQGSDPSDWNALTKMGAYKVNRSSWSGTTGTPLDAQPVGLLNVLTSTDTTTQIFYPGTVDVNNAKIQWNRSLWDGAWTQWYKVVNDGQVIDAGAYN